VTHLKAENVSCRSLWLPQSMEYDAQLQLTSCNPGLILANHGLITGKWPGFNKATHYSHPILSGGVKLHCLTCAQLCTILTLMHCMMCTSRHQRPFVAAHSLTYPVTLCIRVFQPDPHIFRPPHLVSKFGEKFSAYRQVYMVLLFKRLTLL